MRLLSVRVVWVGCWWWCSGGTAVGMWGIVGGCVGGGV